MTCKFCGHGKTACEAEIGDLLFLCTREQGHEGPHVACSISEHDLTHAVTCGYCTPPGTPDDEMCAAAKFPFGCTRWKNHSGPHVACGVIGHCYEMWGVADAGADVVHLDNGKGGPGR